MLYKVLVELFKVLFPETEYAYCILHFFMYVGGSGSLLQWIYWKASVFITTQPTSHYQNNTGKNTGIVVTVGWQNSQENQYIAYIKIIFNLLCACWV